jgi:ketosteroid isomerase-like protein
MTEDEPVAGDPTHGPEDRTIGNPAEPTGRSTRGRSRLPWQIIAACVLGAALVAGSWMCSSRAVSAAPLPADRSVTLRIMTPDSADVASVVAQFHRALTTGDSAAAMRLLSSDVVILESGDSETRAHYEAEHLAADIAFSRATSSTRGALRVMVVSDVAWVTSTDVTTGTYHGRAIDSAGAEMMVLSRTPRGWRIRAVHWSSHTRRPAR